MRFLPLSRRFGTLLVLTALFPAVPATAQDVAPAADADAALAAARRTAQTLAAREDVAGALEVLRQAERKYGADAGLHLEEGRLYLALARQMIARGEDDTMIRALFADASSHAKKALAADPEMQDAVLLGADAAEAGGDRDAARQGLRSWTLTHPKDAVVRRALGDLSFAARDWSDADLQYTRSLEVDATNGLARLNQTEARQWMGIAAEELEKGYLDAARLLPDQDRPLRLLANLHPGARDKKLELLRKVVAENPRAVWARVWIAYVLRKEEPADSKAAFAVLVEARQVAPENATVHFNLGEMLDEAGDEAGALTEYTLAVEKGGPGEMRGASVAIDRLLHVAPGHTKVPVAARVRAYDAVCAKNPSEGSFGNNAGFWFREAKDYEKSLKYYLLSVKAAPDDQDFVNDTALIYLFHLTDRKERCLPMLEHVLELVEKDGQEPKRGYWDALENLCKYWFEKGEYAKTVECATKRASPKAAMNGRPYPSMVAAGWKRRAEAELAK